MKNLLLLFLSLIVSQLNAQQSTLSLLSSSGDYFESGSYSLSWSLGELTIETFVNTEYILTQGFQQTKLSTVGVQEQSFNEKQLNIYPNPAKNELFVTSATPQNQIFLVQIYDLIGSKKIEQNINITTQKVNIKINNLNPGTYMLVFKTKDNEIYQTFLFQKID